MTSEIRTNSLTSRAGLSTVTLTDSGPMFSGITTFVDNSTFSVGTGGTIHAPATNTLNIGVNNTESLRIDSSSNLKIAGVCTAPHFYGNGSNLSGVSGVSVAGQADNRLITATGTTDSLNAEATLTYSSGTMLLTNSSGDAYIKLSRNASVSDGTAIGTIDFCNNTGSTTNARVAAYASGGGNVGGEIYFETRDPSNSTLSEKVRITDNGAVLIGGVRTDNSGFGNKLLVSGGTIGLDGNGNDIGMHWHRTSGDTEGYIGIGDWAVTGGAADDFGIAAKGNLLFGTSSGTWAEKMRITLAGKMGVGTSSPNRTLTVESNGGQMSINDTDNTNGGIFCNAGNFALYARGNSSLGDGSVGGVFTVQTHTAGGSTAERFRIDSDGILTQTANKASGYICLLYTSPSPRDLSTSRMPSSA